MEVVQPPPPRQTNGLLRASKSFSYCFAAESAFNIRERADRPAVWLQMALGGMDYSLLSGVSEEMKDQGTAVHVPVV